jgi:hypothetical protein
MAETKKELAFSATVIAKDEEPIEMEAAVLGNKIRIGLRFVREGDQTASWKWTDGRVDFTFKGWTNALGSSFADHQPFGDVGGRPIFMNVAHFCISNMHLMHFSVMAGDKP